MNRNQRKRPEEPRGRLQIIRPGIMFGPDTMPYTGGKIQALAMSMGWPGPPVLGFRHPQYDLQTEAAEDWLNKNQKRAGLFFGFNRRGGWGLFEKKTENQPGGG